MRHWGTRVGMAETEIEQLLKRLREAITLTANLEFELGRDLASEEKDPLYAAMSEYGRGVLAVQEFLLSAEAWANMGEEPFRERVEIVKKRNWEKMAEAIQNA